MKYCVKRHITLKINICITDLFNETDMKLNDFVITIRSSVMGCKGINRALFQDIELA
jgi:hypothetical protein